MTTFAELGVPAEIVKVLVADGKSEAFPIQVDTLPATLDGGDVLGRGRTGSGKTLAFSIPLVAGLAELDVDRGHRVDRGARCSLTNEGPQPSSSSPGSAEPSSAIAQSCHSSIHY